MNYFQYPKIIQPDFVRFLYGGISSKHVVYVVLVVIDQLVGVARARGGVLVPMPQPLVGAIDARPS